MWKQIAVDMEEDFDVKFTHLQIKNHYKIVGKKNGSHTL